MELSNKQKKTKDIKIRQERKKHHNRRDKDTIVRWTTKNLIYIKYRYIAFKRYALSE
jgi:hypothetical protein